MSSHQLVDHLFRNRAGQLVAWLTRIFGPAHLDLAEEVVQDALLKALQQWPYSGVPQNPGGWLFRVARNGALDVLRRNAVFAARAHEITTELERFSGLRADDPSDEAIEDDELRMVFMCCHPSLAPDARVALSLKTVGGFSVTEIARSSRLNRRSRSGSCAPNASCASSESASICHTAPTWACAPIRCSSRRARRPRPRDSQL